MHAERANEVPLHHPERLSEQQRAGGLHGDAVHDLAPELVRQQSVELGARHAQAGPRRDRAAVAGFGEPEPLDVALRERHGGVEADDGEAPRDREDGLHDRFARGRVEVVELRGVVPRDAGAVVAVVDVARVAGVTVHASEHDGRVAAIPVVVLDAHRDALVVGQLGAVERVRRVRTVPALQEPVGVLDHPARVDPHVVGHHVARQPDAALPGALAQVVPRVLAAQLVRDDVVVHRIGRRRGVGVAGVLLDAGRGAAALPDADEPERGDAERRHAVELAVGHLIESRDGASMVARELVEPHQRALGDHHGARHPVGVVAETLGLLVGSRVVGHVGLGAVVCAGGAVAGGQPAFLLATQVEREPHALHEVAHQPAPLLLHPLELCDQGVRGRAHGCAQEVEQRFAAGSHAGTAVEEARELGRGGARHGAERERGVVEQVAVRGRGGVGVGEREEQPLLERHLAVRATVAGIREPLGGGAFPAIDRDGREAIGEREQQAVHRRPSERTLEVRERVGETVRVAVRPPVRDREMRGLVEQPEREQLGGRGPRGSASRAIQRAREAVRGGGAREHDATRRGEQRLVEGAAVTGLARDVELARQDGRSAGGHAAPECSRGPAVVRPALRAGPRGL
ncbi:MAG: hypothetical protein RL721_1442 [Candidatus Eisenbacteria bacterium]